MKKDHRTATMCVFFSLKEEQQSGANVVCQRSPFPFAFFAAVVAVS